MDIGFYEEFPSEENLNKLKLIKFPTRLFIAAKSINEFKRLEKYVKKIKWDVKIAYWPLIPNSYWISPFSNNKDLKKVFGDSENIGNNLLIDLEMPLKKILILKNSIIFFRNKRLIKRFMEKNKHKITTAEPVEMLFLRNLRRRGQDFKVRTEKSLMWYSSCHGEKVNGLIKMDLAKLENKEDYSISLGTIARGILGNEPLMPPMKLERDLEFIKKIGFKRVIIFRLGGLNKEYIKVLNKFSKL